MKFSLCKFPLQKESLCPVFRDFPAYYCSQWPLPQNNTYAKETHFEAAYSGTLHWYPSFTKSDPSEKILTKGCFSPYLSNDFIPLDSQ